MQTKTKMHKNTFKLLQHSHAYLMLTKIGNLIIAEMHDCSSLVYYRMCMITLFGYARHIDQNLTKMGCISRITGGSERKFSYFGRCWPMPVTAPFSPIRSTVSFAVFKIMNGHTFTYSCESNPNKAEIQYKTTQFFGVSRHLNRPYEI